MNRLTLEDLKFTNRNFWGGFFASSFPTAFDEASDQTLSELMVEHNLADCGWWDRFVGYYEGILDESDGYVEHPKTFCTDLTPSVSLKVEFHPGDTRYIVNGKEIASTGPHYHIQIFSFMELLAYTEIQRDDRLFLLLLPLVYIKPEESEQAAKLIQTKLGTWFAPPFTQWIANSIVYGLREEA